MQSSLSLFLTGLARQSSSTLLLVPSQLTSLQLQAASQEHHELIAKHLPQQTCMALPVPCFDSLLCCLAGVPCCFKD